MRPLVSRRESQGSLRQIQSPSYVLSAVRNLSYKHAREEHSPPHLMSPWSQRIDADRFLCKFGRFGICFESLVTYSGDCPRDEVSRLEIDGWPRFGRSAFRYEDLRLDRTNDP